MTRPMTGNGAVGDETPPRSRWIHPRCVSPSLQLPCVFDEQRLVQLDDGRLLTVTDSGNATTVSSDAGRTWSFPRVMRARATPVLPTRGPLVRTANGVLLLMFQEHAGVDERWNEKDRDWTPAYRSDLWVTRSLDNGETWETPVRPFDGAYGTIVDAIQTRTGHVVVPIQIALRGSGRWGTYVFVSADDGASWSRSNLIDLGGSGHHDGAIEPTLAELGNGRLLMLIRTGLDRFWEAYSEDNGYHWRELRPSQLDASAAPGQLHRLASSRLVLVWNRLGLEGQVDVPRARPSAAYAHAVSAQRKELSIAFSDDDARTWSEPVVLARQSPGSLAYPTLLEPEPGTLWVWTRYGSMPPLCVELQERDFVTV